MKTHIDKPSATAIGPSTEPVDGGLGAADCEDVAVIPTGSPELDEALGVGGYPRGRIIELYGPEAVAMTTLVLHAAREVQRVGGVVAFLDATHALDLSYASAIGVDPERLLVSQPESVEQTLSVCRLLAKSGAVDLIVVDSVEELAGLGARHLEVDGYLVSVEPSGARPGINVATADGQWMGWTDPDGTLMSTAGTDPDLEATVARVSAAYRARVDTERAHLAMHVARVLRTLAPIAERTGTTILFINHLRPKPAQALGAHELPPGTTALKFYASVRIDVRRIGEVLDGDTVVGARTLAKVVKNKCAVPFREAEFDIRWGKGIAAPADPAAGVQPLHDGEVL